MIKSLMAVIILSLSVATVLGEARTPPLNLMECRQSPYVANKSGAEVFLGRVTSKRPMMGSDGVERGQVEIAVQEVIHGSAINKLLLSYSYQGATKIGRNLGQTDVWSDSTTKEGSLLLVVVIPKASDVPANFQEGTYGATCNVYPVSGAKDPKVEAYREISQMELLKGDTLVKSLSDGAQSKEPIERRYVEEAAFKRLDPGAATRIIEMVIKTGANEKRFSYDIESGLQHLGHLAVDADLGNDEQRQDAQRVLTREMASTNADVRSIALQYIAGLISNKFVKPAAELLSPDDLQNIKNAVEGDSKSANGLVRQCATEVLAWLNGGK